MSSIRRALSTAGLALGASLSLLACAEPGSAPRPVASAGAAPVATGGKLAAGRTALAAGDAIRAESLLNDALREGSKDAITLSLLGVSLDMQGKQAQAQARYREALALDPAHAGARNNLALSLALSGRGSDAVVILEPLAGGTGAGGRARHNLAVAYAASGDATRAAGLLAPELGGGATAAADAWRAALAGS
ncbi:hypothetical protein EAH89_05900 [Roseomonas nepalensis]|uniref:Uncharacterized protein n=1 Tax=Muricoccus nepalensis TaxID=1854500 RepID=A0A502GCE1_9PROT|nr:tetratricopeptide repeat protein [Roseomonas nepalensis]TPG59759.1 hypothetical protein EAH89_05900 [Roseomonas nepalensis]